ncbi:MAG TPA: LacI family DNA-binding transcriptional regulator [Ktedonobacterales bacterium]|nr:LacI family DNA-binding transcriptional regulator [Ktedonobacterales bacterium]
MPSKLTIRDIARLAGVSTATVSRVLNHKPDVDPETRQRVMRVVDEHGYVPSVSASSLAGGRSRLLGALTPSLTWPLMPHIMQGIAEVIEETDYELVLYSISHRTDRSAMIDRILEARLIDGLIAVYPDGIARAEPSESPERAASSHLSELYQHGFPVVILDDQSLPGHTPWVGPDNRVGAYEAVRHLARLGHTRIAHIQGPLQYQCSHDRYEGYRQALAEAGITPEPAYAVRGDFTTAGSYAAAQELLALDERPTAIFAGNDQMAYSVLSVARAQGLRIPEDLALIGFDDTELSIYVRPALTTVRQPFETMGRTAAELLLSLVNAPHSFDAEWYERAPQAAQTRFSRAALKAMQIQAPTELVVRESCGAQLLVDAQPPVQPGAQPSALPASPGLTFASGLEMHIPAGQRPDHAPYAGAAPIRTPTPRVEEA